jgi:hypothetical protein
LNSRYSGGPPCARHHRSPPEAGGCTAALGLPSPLANIIAELAGDPRLTDGLSNLGRLFIFSAMHHQFAVGDFEAARFEILRFPRDHYTGERRAEVFAFNERDAVDLITLNDAIDRTFKIWREILDERTEEMRRHPPTGTDDGFGF